jgi:CRP/FNR family nitrogen fixation transcriptional regulator
MLRQNAQTINPTQRAKPFNAWVVPQADAVGASFAFMGVPVSFARNEEVCGEGEPADYVYQVLSGASRSYRVLNDGRRQICAFYLPGEVFGLGVGDVHHCSAEAIGKSSILLIKRKALVGLATADHRVAQLLWTLTARELRRVQDHMLLLIRSAQERVACFLLEMAERMGQTEVIDLPMSRQDIADYLGLTIETVSRTLTQLENEAAISVPTCRRIVLRDRKALKRLHA